MFALKKIIGLMIEPLSLVFLLLLMGAVLIGLNRARSGRGLLLVAVCTLYLFSIAPVSERLITPLERKFPAWQASAEHTVDVVVVLGGGHRTDPELPITSQLKSFSLARLSEGVRIWHHNPHSQLILSGFAGRDPHTNAEMMQMLALQLGVRADAIVVEPRPKDTAAEARLIAPLLRGKNSVLVTSGYHMPRAMALFARQGASPTPAPTEHLARAVQGTSFVRWWPTPSNLLMSSRAVHEYAGLAWSRLRDQL